MIFKTQPYEHQLRALSFLKDKQVAAIFAEMGTGKTKIIIDDAARLYREKKALIVLVVCPNSIKSTWEEEIKIHSSIPQNITHAYASKKKFHEWRETEIQGPALLWLIVAVESLSQGGAFHELLHFMERAPNVLMIIDESSTIKGHRAKRTKNVIILSRNATYKRILSGTPISKGVEDLFMQFYFLDPHIIDARSFYAFRNRYCRMGGWQGKQIIGYANLGDLMVKLEPHTFRVTKKEALTLPEKVYEKRAVKMSPQQEEIYKSMHTNLMAELGGGSVTVTTALSKLLRLQQITGGFLPVEKEEGYGWDPKEIPGPNPKLDEIESLLDQIGDEKMIIWAKFRAEIEAVHKRLLGAGVSAVAVHGGVSESDRTRFRHAFQNDPSIRVYVGQPEAGGIGVTLTAASVVVYYSNSFSSVARIQSEDRAHRIGQKKSVTYVDLVSDKTIDVKVLKAVKNKIDFSNVVMDAIEKGEWKDAI